MRDPAEEQDRRLPRRFGVTRQPAKSPSAGGIFSFPWRWPLAGGPPPHPGFARRDGGAA